MKFLFWNIIYGLDTLVITSSNPQRLLESPLKTIYSESRHPCFFIFIANVNCNTLRKHVCRWSRMVDIIAMLLGVLILRSVFYIIRHQCVICISNFSQGAHDAKKKNRTCIDDSVVSLFIVQSRSTLRLPSGLRFAQWISSTEKLSEVW